MDENNTDKAINSINDEADNPNYFWKNPINQILIVLLFALATGHAWHIRGSGPWGGMIGMWTVGTMVMLLIFFLFGDRVKAKPIWAGLMVTLMALTAGGWGTINRQITGRLYSANLYDIPVNPWSGAFYMFLIGFGWCPLFGFVLGYFFTDRKYNLKEFLGIIILFFIISYFSKLVVGHLIIPSTASDAYALFVDYSLAEFDLTPWEMYLQNFYDTKALYIYPGGRNYVSMVDNFANSFAALVLWVVLKWGFKDKKVAKYSIAIPLIVGFSILIANLWMFWDAGCLYNAETQSYSCVAPDWLKGIGWGMWEYSTGFGTGLGIAILVLREDPREYKRTAIISDSIFTPKLEKLVEFFTFYGVVIFASLWFPISSLVDRWGYETWRYPVLIIGGLFTASGLFLYRKGKFQMPKYSVQKYAVLMLIIFWSLVFILDQFLTPKSTPDWRHVQDYLDVISFACGIPLLFILCKRVSKTWKNETIIQSEK
jgi:hypothetical protein